MDYRWSSYPAFINQTELEDKTANDEIMDFVEKVLKQKKSDSTQRSNGKRCSLPYHVLNQAAIVP